MMRDLMAALASAGNLKQTLEAVLVNLHNIIHYDRASLFLVNENEQIVNPHAAIQTRSIPVGRSAKAIRWSTSYARRKNPSSSAISRAIRALKACPICRQCAAGWERLCSSARI